MGIKTCVLSIALACQEVKSQMNIIKIQFKNIFVIIFLSSFSTIWSTLPALKLKLACFEPSGDLFLNEWDKFYSSV